MAQVLSSIIKNLQGTFPKTRGKPPGLETPPGLPSLKISAGVYLKLQRQIFDPQSVNSVRQPFGSGSSGLQAARPR